MRKHSTTPHHCQRQPPKNSIANNSIITSIVKYPPAVPGCCRERLLDSRLDRYQTRLAGREDWHQVDPTSLRTVTAGDSIREEQAFLHIRKMEGSTSGVRHLVLGKAGSQVRSLGHGGQRVEQGDGESLDRQLGSEQPAWQRSGAGLGTHSSRDAAHGSWCPETACCSITKQEQEKKKGVNVLSSNRPREMKQPLKA